MNGFRLEGLVSAPFTPMFADGTVNYETIEQQAASLIANDITGAFVCGTTGESLSLTVPERNLIVERWKGFVGTELKLIAHVGHTSVEAAKELAAHAEANGADAIACMAPCFFKPSKVEDLVDFCAKVASGAPATPFYFYQIPCITGVAIPMYDFLTCASDKIPTLTGVKFTYEDLMDFARCVRLEDGRYDMLFGRDEMMLSGLAVGSKGAVGSTFNYTAPVYHMIRKAYDSGDMALAQELQEKANAMIAVLIKHGGSPATGKAFMKYIGLDCGGVRSPLRSLTDEQYQQLAADADAVGLREFASRLA
ncbi:MAG: dihydrodipicolinate synthase family protein [Kiritimatiellae bacterium]|jgi:N-acetylneuraminate lyase|nr:dihydrodipicolinate synthase family protein [Kiritimatiellia bacterium]